MSGLRFHGVEVLTDLADIVAPERTALLIYDALQHNVGRQAADDPGLLPRWAGLLDAARAVGVLVVYTRHRRDPAFVSGAWLRYRMRVFGVDDPAELPDFRQAPAGSHEIVDELAPRRDEPVVDKYLNSAFQGTPLRQVLAAAGRKCLVITGVATESGVETTARQAFVEGYDTVVVQDAVASANADFHAASLRYMRRSFEVVSAADLEAVWRRGRS